MIKVKVAELQGVALDWAVSFCEEPVYTVGQIINVPILVAHKKYSTDWLLGGPIIESQDITVIRCEDEYLVDDKGYCTNMGVPKWAAEQGGGHSYHYSNQYEIDHSDCSYGATPLIAAMRCYVRSYMGDEIGIPKELL